MFVTILMCSALLTPSNADQIMSTEQLHRLSTVVDGLDSRGDGFAALIEHVDGWRDVQVEGQTAPMQSLCLEPNLFRGDLFLVKGTLEQVAPLGNPWEDVSEWFVRSNEGDLCVLYVSGQTNVKAGTSIETVARFYKTMSMQGRDQQHRLYPTFVTSSIGIQTEAFWSMYSTLIFGLVLVLGVIVFLLQRHNSKRERRVVYSTL